MDIKTFNPPDVPAPPPTYKQVATVSLSPDLKLVTLAGQVGIDSKTGNVPSSFLDQVRIAYDNLRKCLSAAGATPKNVVHVRHYIVQTTGDPDLDAKDVLDRGWGELWTSFLDEVADGHRPPDTVLGVASLAKKSLLYEVEVWALAPNS